MGARLLALVVLTVAWPVLGQDLLTRFNEALVGEDWPAAVAAGEELVGAWPEDSTLRYNLACAYAGNGQAEEVIRTLQVAADLGFRLISTLTTDPDLDGVRGHPDFPAVRVAVERNSADALVAFRERSGEARVLTFLPKGRAPAEPAPLVVALHGFGGDAEGFAEVYRAVAAQIGAVLVVPEALTPAGPGFSWGVVEEAEALVLGAIEKARAEHRIDPQRIVLTGFSQGGYLAYTLGLWHPELFAGVIPVGGSYDPRLAPVPDGGTEVPRFFIMYGALDGDLENNRQAARILRQAGVKSKLQIYPGVGHSYPWDREAELRRALRFVLASRGSSPDPRD